MKRKLCLASFGFVGLGVAMAALSGCTSESSTAGSGTPAEGSPASSGISPQVFADAVHSVMMADRTVYAKHVVTRLKAQKATVTPSEFWQDEKHTIPLPAQMFRMGAEMVSENESAGFSYALKSKWPLNSQNKATTPVEIEGLDFVAANPEKVFYGEEVLAGQNYFTAVYGDSAVAEACWVCHNEHENRGDDYPEFKKGDVMGGVIVRVPID